LFYCRAKLNFALNKHTLIVKIIGITGTLGAGKGTIVGFLSTKKGYVHYSVRAYLIEEIEKRGMKVNATAW